MCERRVIHAQGDSFSVRLDEERGGVWIEAIITAPSGDRLVGSMVDSDELVPHFSGSGSTVPHPEEDRNGEASVADLAWLCS